MKKIIAIIAVALPLGFSAHAQFIVEDPANLAEQIANEAENIAQFVSMVDNQVQQIQQLSDQLSEFKNYEKLFGNPSQVALSMVPALNSDLQSTEPIQSLENLVSSANGNYALTYNDNGIYATVGVNFQTPRGQTVQRPADEYKKYAAINETANNFITVADNATQRRATIKNQIAQTTKQLQSATTDAEVQKLQGVLIGLNAALNNTDYEINQATASALVQDIANRNDTQRQVKAQQQQQHAEFTEAIQKYGQTFKLLNAPTEFPTP